MRVLSSYSPRIELQSNVDKTAHVLALSQADPAPRASGGASSFPLTPGPQHIDDTFEHQSCAHRFSGANAAVPVSMPRHASKNHPSLPWISPLSSLLPARNLRKSYFLIIYGLSLMRIRTAQLARRFLPLIQALLDSRLPYSRLPTAGRAARSRWRGASMREHKKMLPAFLKSRSSIAG